MVASTGCCFAETCWVCPSAQHFVCPLPHLLPGSACWGAPKALGSQHWVLLRRGLSSVPQCAALCVPTTPPAARQRVLGHAKGPWQPALGAALPGPVGCAPVHSTLRAHHPTCCLVACVRARWGPLAANTGRYPTGACWVCPSVWHFVCQLPHLLPGSVCWGTLGALGSQHWALPCRGSLGVPQCTALCAPTTPPVAWQRVLGHARGPW